MSEPVKVIIGTSDGNEDIIFEMKPYELLMMKYDIRERMGDADAEPINFRDILMIWKEFDENERKHETFRIITNEIGEEHLLSELEKTGLSVEDICKMNPHAVKAFAIQLNCTWGESRRIVQGMKTIVFNALKALHKFTQGHEDEDED